MSLTRIRSVAGAALLAALATGCGTAVAAHSTAPKPAAAPSHSAPVHAAVTTPPAQPSHPAPAHTAVTTPPARPATSPANPIPQGNGGDHDSDNNGGPSDGDGTL